MKLNLLKTHQVSFYSTEKLPERDIEYSALYSIVSQKIGEAFSRESKAKLASCSESNYFEEGEEVTIWVDGKIVCAGRICHIGGNGNDVLWGSMIMNDGKVLVKIGKSLHSQI